MTAEYFDSISVLEELIGFSEEMARRRKNLCWGKTGVCTGNRWVTFRGCKRELDRMGELCEIHVVDEDPNGSPVRFLAGWLDCESDLIHERSEFTSVCGVTPNGV